MIQIASNFYIGWDSLMRILEAQFLAFAYVHELMLHHVDTHTQKYAFTANCAKRQGIEI
jgi:hypothetical protein